MRVDIEQVDKHLRFLKAQANGLRSRQGGAAWAEANATQFDQIAEILRQLRQEQQMTGMSGERIG
jgi:hypothetical protein